MKKDSKLVVYDIFLIVLALYVSLLLKFDFQIDKDYFTLFKWQIVPVILIILFFNYVFNLYNNIWRYASIQELLSVVYSVSISNIIILIYSYFINYRIAIYKNIYRFPFSVHLIFWMIAILFLGGIRFTYRIRYNKYLKVRGGNDKRVLIIGAGDAAAMMIKEIKKHLEFNYYIVGLIDDDKSKLGKRINNIKVLGGREDIKKICENENVEEIIFAIPSIDYENKKKIIEVCKDIKCKLKTIPGVYEIIDEKVEISKLRDINIDDLLGREEVTLDSKNIEEFIKGKTILVTGGGGSIGSELCRQIAKYSPKLLLILDIYENNAYDLQMELNFKNKDLKKEVLIASIRDKEKLEEIFLKYDIDIVFHAAAHKHVPLMEASPSEAIKNNIIGTYNVLQCCNKYGVKKFVQISTDKAVNPTNIMGATKRFCEIMVQAFDRVSKTEYVAVRFGNVLGSNGSVIPLFTKQIANGGPVTVTHPDINRFFMTISEASQLVIQAGAMASGGEIFVLDMGKPVKIANLARDMIRLSGYKPDEDIRIEYTGLRPGEKLYEELLISGTLTSTKHRKIFIEQPQVFEMSFVNESIDEFKEILKKDTELIYKIMEKKVPTYTRTKNEN